MPIVGFRMNPVLAALMRAMLIGGMALLPVLVMEYAIVDELTDRFNTVGTNEAYDFIIVGAGTTGSIVANRLSAKYRVLLLEAGGEPNPMQSIPGIAGIFLDNPVLDWRFFTVPQKHSCFALNNKQSLWPRGKALGGTGNLNFMAYIRGHPLDYDNWAHLVGDDRWSYENMLPYFKKSEDYHGSNDSRYHGHDGELTIESSSWSPLGKYFVEAANELGYPQVDLNAPYTEAGIGVPQGFSEFEFTKKRGARWGSLQAFINPIRKTRKNLTIRKYSLVSKVLIKGSNNMAYGVEYERHGRTYQVLANKEVILSAGTVKTPQILMLSGVGPADHLRSFGIDPLVNLPGVGENLQDHVVGYTGPFVIDKPLTFLLDRDANGGNFIQYISSGTGPFSANGITGTGLYVSNYSNQIHLLPQHRWPDTQLILFALPVHNDGPPLLAKLFNMDATKAEKYYRPVAGKDSFHIMSVKTRPKSRGRIQLESNNPRDPPLIDPNYLEHPDDVAVIVEGMKKAVDMVERTSSFQAIGGRLSDVPFPDCAEVPFRSDAYYECYLRHVTLSVYHPVGSCAMGQATDPRAVVDSSLRVIGVQRLRIIDASVMPQIVSTNVQATCMAIGERGSQMILDDWNSKSG